MDSATRFPISFDRPSRPPMTVLGAGPNVSHVQVSSSAVDIRMGWAFHATIPRAAIRSARSLHRDELRGPFRLSVLRGVNYWRGTALVNGAGTGLVELILDPPELVRLGLFAARVHRLIVSTEDQSGLVAALSTNTAGSAGPAEPQP